MKPTNILAFKGDVLKITDFGMAKEHDENTLSLSAKGHRKYSAPEVLMLDVR